MGVTSSTLLSLAWWFPGLRDVGVGGCCSLA